MKTQVNAAQVRLLLQLVQRDSRRDPPVAGAPVVDRAALEKDLPSPLLDRYNALLRTGRWPPVVPIANSACSGCHLRLPTMLESQARLSLALHTCPHCRRLLYLPELLGQERRPGGKSARRAASAADSRPSGRSRA